MPPADRQVSNILFEFKTSYTISKSVTWGFSLSNCLYYFEGLVLCALKSGLSKPSRTYFICDLKTKYVILGHV